MLLLVELLLIHTYIHIHIYIYMIILMVLMILVIIIKEPPPSPSRQEDLTGAGLLLPNELQRLGSGVHHIEALCVLHVRPWVLGAVGALRA